MLRFIITIMFNLHLCIYFCLKIKKINKNKTMTLQEKYDEMQKIIKKVVKKSRVTVIVEGVDNLPDENGYVLYTNHQGRFDGLAVLTAHKRQLSFVIDEKKSHGAIADGLYDALYSKRILKDNPRQCIEKFSEITKEMIEQKKNFCIFPEGIYGDNHNTLQKFYTGCMHFVYKVKCPLIPVCLYDTYVPYNTNSLKRVSCHVHFLKPIFYEEYGNMSKSDLAELIKSKIQREIDKLNSLKVAA